MTTSRTSSLHQRDEESPSRRRQPEFNPPGIPSTLWGTETVLVVDSIPLERAALVGLFGQLGYHVLEAATAAQARRLAHISGRIHLVFLDLTLPEASELHLARWFQAHDPEIRTLVAANSLWELSYHASDSDRIPFLIKPFTPMELAWMVRRILG